MMDEMEMFVKQNGNNKSADKRKAKHKRLWSVQQSHLGERGVPGHVRAEYVDT